MNITRIFCAFPIFAPSKKMFDRNMASVVSFVEYLKTNSFYLDGSRGHLLDMYFGGWALKDEYWDEMKRFIKDNLPSAKMFRFDKNYGKAKVVNSLAKEYSIDYPNTEFMFTMDSDMQLINDQLFMFDRLILAASALQNNLKKPFGMISLDQKGECCHWYEPRSGYTGMNQYMDYTLDGSGVKLSERLVWSSDGAGIAGGGLFLNFKMFKQLNGYSVGNHPYHGEDGFILRDIQRLGAAVAISKTISLIHPKPDDDSEYRAWKDLAMRETWESFDPNKNIDRIEKSMEIWKK